MRDFFEMVGAIVTIGAAALGAALFAGLVFGAFIGAIGGFIVLMIRVALAVLT